MPMNTTDANPNTKEAKSVELHMQSPNDFAQSAQPGSQVTPMLGQLTGPRRQVQNQVHNSTQIMY